MSNYSSSNYDSQYARGSESINFSATSSNYSNVNRGSAQKFQQSRHNRFGAQAHSVPSSHSLFDLTNPNYLNGDAPRARSSSPQKANSRTHIMPNAAGNNYDISVPAILIKPPLISGAKSSKTSLDSKSGSNAHSRAQSAESLLLAVPSQLLGSKLALHRQSVPVQASMSFAPQPQPSHSFESNFQFPQRGNPADNKQRALPKEPSQYSILTQSSGADHASSSGKHISMPPIVQTASNKENSFQQHTNSSGSRSQIQNHAAQQQHQQPPQHQSQQQQHQRQQQQLNRQLQGHAKTFSVPAIGHHTRNRSSISLVNSNDYSVNNSLMNTNAVFDFNELNELQKAASNGSSKGGKDGEHAKGKDGKTKKRHKFWRFGLKKNSNGKSKKAVAKEAKGLPLEQKEVIEDTDAHNNFNQSSTHDYSSLSLLGNHDVPMVPRSSSPQKSVNSNAGTQADPSSGSQHSCFHEIEESFDEEADAVGKPSLLESIPIPTFETNDLKSNANSPQMLRRPVGLFLEANQTSTMKPSMSSAASDVSSLKRHAASNIYNFDHYSLRKPSGDADSTVSKSSSDKKTITSFKNSIQDNQYHDLIRRNLLSTQSNTSSQTYLSNPFSSKSCTLSPETNHSTSSLQNQLKNAVSTSSFNRSEASHQTTTSSDRFKVNSEKGYIVFTAESESLNMGALPASKRLSMSSSQNTIISKDNTVVRHRPMPLAPPQLPVRPKTLHDAPEAGTRGNDPNNERSFSFNSSSSRTSSNASSSDPALVYSPINDTFSMSSHANSSVESISTLDTKEVSTGEAYKLFTSKAEEPKKFEQILEEGNSTILSDVGENTSVYSELGSEFVINKDYSLADTAENSNTFTLNSATNNEFTERDRANILSSLVEETEPEDEDLSIKTTPKGTRSPNKVFDELVSEKNAQEDVFNASDYEDLIKNYTCEYSDSEDTNNSSRVSSINALDPTATSGNKSLDVIHYYELNSSKSTFRNSGDNVSTSRGHQQYRNYTNDSFASSVFSSSVNSPSNLRTVNTAEDYHDTLQSKEHDTLLRLSTIEGSASLASSATTKNTRDFSFASSIASDIQFSKNIAKQNQIQLALLNETEMERNFSTSDSSVLYYSDSDLVKNPVFSTKASTEAWDSVSNTSRSNSGASVSGASTLLSAVNSLYGDYIHKKGYKDIEDLCLLNSVSLPDAIKQIKLETALGKKGAPINGGSLYSSLGSFASSISGDSNSAYSSSIHSANQNGSNPLTGYFNNKRNPMLNNSTSYQYSYMNS